MKSEIHHVRLADLVAGSMIAIVGILVVLPLLQSIRASANHSTCVDHLRKIGDGVRSFADSHHFELPRDRIQAPTAGWNTELLPYIGQETTYRQFSQSLNWWDRQNRDAIRKRITTFLCPAAPHPTRRILTTAPEETPITIEAGATDYVGSAGAYYFNNRQENLHPGAMHHRKITRRIRYSDIQDGLSTTIFVVEMADKPNIWRAGKLVEARSKKPQMPALSGQWAAPNWNHLRSYSTDGTTAFGSCAVNCSNQASLYGFHRDGANSLFVDGSVRMLKPGLSQELLIALVSIDGGEILSDQDY